MIDISAGGGNGSSLTPGQYTDTGADVPSVSSKSGVKDSAYWNSHYGEGYVNSVTSSINQAIEEYDVETDIANEAIKVASSFYTENGVVYKVVTNEDGTIEKVPLGNIDDLNGLEIDTSQINWDSISTTANGALNGNFLDPNNINKEYWGDNGQLTIQIGENGAILILENGVPMGWTTIDGINIDIEDELTLEFGEYRNNPDGSITYVNARGETITISENDIFVDDDGRKFFISSIDENGNINGVLSLNEDGTLSGYTSRNNNNLGEIFDIQSGEYFKSAGGDIIYNVNGDYKIVNNEKLVNINGEYYFVSNCDKEGNVSGLMKISEDKVSGYYGSQIEEIFGSMTEDYDATISNDGSIIYKFGDEYRIINSEDMFEIDGNQYYVSRSNEDGKVSSMLSFDNENGKMISYNGSDVNGTNVFDSIDSATYLETSNGDIIYSDYQGNVTYVEATSIITNANGNKVLEGKGGIDLIFGEDGTVSTEYR